MPFVEGFGIGLLLMFVVGPVFFTLLHTALSKGLFVGYSLALGIFISDVICVLLCVYGASEILKNPDNHFYLGMLGGLLLLFFGTNYLFKPPTPSLIPSDNPDNSRYYIAFTKGFAVNFLNPTVFVIWLSIIGNASGKYGFGGKLAIYMSGTLSAIFMTDMLKATFAAKLSGILNKKWLIRFFRSVGFLLIFFGLRLLYKTIQVWVN